MKLPKLIMANAVLAGCTCALCWRFGTAHPKLNGTTHCMGRPRISAKQRKAWKQLGKSSLNRKKFLEAWNVTEEEANAQFNKTQVKEDTKGHDVVYFYHEDKNLQKRTGNRRAATCTRCWRYQIKGNFRQECQKERCRRNGWKHLQTSPKLLKRLLGIWKVTKKQAEVAFSRLVQEGVEPNPGPTTYSTLRKTISCVSLIAPEGQ